jgi:SAM-dependent methyltransferase
MEEVDQQYEYWNSVAWDKVFTHPFNVELLRAHVPTEGRVLDYGCGYGRTVRELADNGYRDLVGVDPSPLMIERGRRTYPDLHLEVLPASRLLQEDSFDAIILFAVLTCIPTGAGQRELIKKLSRLLRPRGVVYVSDYFLQADERNLRRYEKFAAEFGTYGVFRLADGAVMRHHAAGWIESLLSEFEIIDLSHLDVATMNGNQAKVFQCVGRKQS